MDERGRELVSIGGDLVAAVTSAIPIAGGPIAAVIATAGNVKRDREVAFVRHLVEKLGDRVDRLEAAAADRELSDLVGHGIDVAAVCRADDLLGLGAGIVADGLDAGAREEHLSRAHLLLDILGQLHSDHIQVLRTIATEGPREIGSALDPLTGAGVPPERLPDLLPELAEIVPQLVAWLTALGLVRNAGDQSAGTNVRIGPPAIGLTTFGVELLQHLDDPS